MTIQQGMKPLTKMSHAILSLVPDSQARRGIPNLKWRIARDLNISMLSLEAHWDNLLSGRMIESVDRIIRRTKDGDRALDPVGAIEQEKKSGCEVTTDSSGRPNGFICRRHG